jgi:hypothetical protein
MAHLFVVCRLLAPLVGVRRGPRITTKPNLYFCHNRYVTRRYNHSRELSDAGIKIASDRFSSGELKDGSAKCRGTFGC